MLIIEYNQYNEYKKYFSNKEFMEYFKKLNIKLNELFPTYSFNIELIIDKIYSLYLEGYLIDDTINKLYYNGNLFIFRVTNGDS